MTDKANRESLRRELVRLLDGLDFYRSWVIASIRREKGTITQEDLNQIVEPGASFLQIFDDTKGSRCADVLKAVKGWYSHTSSDLSHLINLGEDALTREVQNFLKDFRKETGFDFYAEAGLLRKMASKALKRHKISTEAEYLCLIEIENDLSQNIISATETLQISKLLRDFESQGNRNTR